MKVRCKILGIRTRISLVIIQGSYVISLVSYKDRTRKSCVDIMKSYMILAWNQRNFKPSGSDTSTREGIKVELKPFYGKRAKRLKCISFLHFHHRLFVFQLLVRDIVAQTPFSFQHKHSWYLQSVQLLSRKCRQHSTDKLFWSRCWMTCILV